MLWKPMESPYDGIFDAIPKVTPTKGEPDGPICGNGDIGVTFSAMQNTLHAYIGKNDMWCFYPHHQKGGMKGVTDIAVEFAGLENASFSARQYIQTADIRIVLESDACKVQIDSFAPYTANIVALRLSCLKGATAFVPKLLFDEDTMGHVETADTATTLSAKKSFDDVKYDYPCVADMLLQRMDKKALAGTLKAGESVVLVYSIKTNFDACALQRNVSEEEIVAFREEHEAFWKAFWGKSAISIPSETKIEQYWYGSLYIMACSSKKDRFAPGIFGPFNTTASPNWGGDYHLNYNYQAPWWGVFSANHVELAEPYDKPLMDYIPKSQAHAKELLHCRGLYSVVGIGPMGHESSKMYNYEDGSENWEVPFWGQKSNASYAAINMLMRYYATYDMEYAKETAYPYIKECAAFWEDYLTWDGVRYIIQNDCIHENAALGKKIWKNDSKPHDYSDDCNPLVSLALVRLVMKGALEFSEKLGVDAEKREKWQHILTHISEYPTFTRNGKTVFRYTETGMEWWKDNSLGIQHIYPCRGIGLESDAKTLQIARDTLTELARWEDYNAFPTFFTAAVYLGYDSKEILQHLNRELNVHGFPNLFVYYGGGGLECCSTVPATIDAMFLQSHEGVIRLFPVWEKEKDASFTNLRAEGAFIISSAIQNGAVQETTLYSEKGITAVVQSPWEKGMQVLCDGKEVCCAKEKYYSFETEAGKTYVLKSK